MKTTLKLEYFDVNKVYQRKKEIGALRRKTCWVAEILAETPDGYVRQFVPRERDYTHSNSRGTRGVYCWYILDEGKIYQVQEQISWRNCVRWFCKIQNAEIVRISEDEVQSILARRNNLEVEHA